MWRRKDGQPAIESTAGSDVAPPDSSHKRHCTGPQEIKASCATEIYLLAWKCYRLNRRHCFNPIPESSHALQTQLKLTKVTAKMSGTTGCTARINFCLQAAVMFFNPDAAATRSEWKSEKLFFF